MKFREINCLHFQDPQKSKDPSQVEFVSMVTNSRNRIQKKGRWLKPALACSDPTLNTASSFLVDLWGWPNTQIDPRHSAISAQILKLGPPKAYHPKNHTTGCIEDIGTKTKLNVFFGVFLQENYVKMKRKRRESAVSSKWFVIWRKISWNCNRKSFHCPKWISTHLYSFWSLSSFRRLMPTKKFYLIPPKNLCLIGQDTHLDLMLPLLDGLKNLSRNLTKI